MINRQKAKLLLAKYRLKELAKEKINKNPEEEAYEYLITNFNKLEECIIIDSRASMESTMSGSSYVPHNLQRDKILSIFHIIGVLYGVIDGRLKQSTMLLEFYYDLNDKMGLYMTQDDITEFQAVKENAPSKLFDLVDPNNDKTSWYDVIASEQFEILKQKISENNGNNFQKNAFLEGYLFGINRTVDVNITEFICEFDFRLKKLKELISTISDDKKLLRDLSNE